MSCVICFSVFSENNLCSFCLHTLENKLNNSNLIENHFENQDFFVYSLIPWNYTNSLIVTRLIHTIKKNQSSEIIKWLVFHLYKKLIANGFINSKKFVFVPSPQYQLEYKSTSSLIANELAMSLGSHSLNLVSKAKPWSQKKKKKKERLQLPIESNYLTSSRLENMIFVDDVITTGSTLLNSWKALGYPKNSFAVTLFFREKEVK
jgi:predicted amidophosphoribosyltransferase